MKADFWHQRWQKNEIGFHEPEASPSLIQYWPELGLPEGGRVFVPLCGKTLDIAWLLSQGYRVAGAELSELAIEQLFAGLGLTPQITSIGKLQHYQAENIDIFVGDIFDLSLDQLGPIDGIYDRAALIALPEVMRQRYTSHLSAITRHAPQLLITLQYDTTLLQGPPFPISHEEIQQHYADGYAAELLEDSELEGDLKGVCPARVNVWALRNKQGKKT